MNIAFDAVAILGPMSKNRGIGNYALSQFTGMVNQDSNNHYFFINMIEKDFSLGELITNKEHFTEDFLDTGKNNVLLRSDAYSDIIGAAIKRYLKENKIDVFYITSPFESCFTLYKKEWFEGVQVVVTVYDIIPYVMKEKYLADKNTYSWYMKCVENLRWADEIYVISESVKTDLVKYLSFSPDNIRVIWGGVGEQYKKIEISSSEKSQLLSKFGVTKDFIMCTGGEDGRKNLDGLVRAYSLMPKDIRDRYQLVVVCKLSENGMKKLTAEAKKCKVENDVVFTNFVTDEELLKFYNLASLMAFPSKYEGFGLPIVEAWACGTPVLTADNSSLVQIGGDAVVLVNADSDRSVADGMAKMLSDESVLEEYTRKGEQRLELYRWTNVNNGTIKLISSIVPYERKERSVPERVKIAFFTPLPPVESGISDYSEDIITALSEYCDIDVFIDNGYTPSSSFADNVKIFSHGEYSSRAGEYFDTVFQVGNSEFHFYMYDYIRKYHGTVVLHDYNMHGAFYHNAITVRNGNYNLYQQFVSADYPEKAADYVQALRGKTSAPDIYGMPLNSYIINCADKVIVHSQEAKKNLLRKDISRNVRIINSYAKILPLADSAPVKEKYGYPADTVVISAFGGIHATKRALPILKAFAKLRESFSNVHLLFAGKLANDIKDDFRHFVSSNKLGDSVTVTGYIDIEQFKEYIDMTDICLNLRYPSNGETSGSLMRILAKGRCVVVNDIGSFSEIPQDCCVMLPSVEKMGEDAEVEKICEALSELISKPEKRQAIADSARKFAEENLDLNIIAGNYFDYITAEKTKCRVTDEALSALSKDEQLRFEDIEGISATIAYAKGAGC